MGGNVVTNAECDFCLRLAEDMRDRPWYDFYVIDRSDWFTIIVALGALVPGHLIIVSNQHVERMADLPQWRILDLEALLLRWARTLTEQWGSPCFIFEHGGRTSAAGKGGCISHAHVQILPLSSHSIGDIGPYREETKLNSALEGVDSHDYLVISRNDHWHVTTEYGISGQFLRRQISAALGFPAEWDYLVFPRLEVMRETINRLKGRPTPPKNSAGS